MTENHVKHQSKNQAGKKTGSQAGRRLQSPEALAILALARIKAAAEAFDSGETNVSDALDAIVAAVEAWQTAGLLRRAAA